MFKDLKVGDNVILSNRVGDYVKIVSNITPSGLIKVDNMLFNPQSGRLRGGSGYDCTYISPVTEEALAKVKQQQNRNMAYNTATAIAGRLMKQPNPVVSNEFVEQLTTLLNSLRG